MHPAAATMLLLLVLVSAAKALVSGSWAVGSSGLELRISISAERGAWDAEVLLGENATIADVSGQPWSTTTPLRISVTLVAALGDVLPLIPYGEPVFSAYETWAAASASECSAAQQSSTKVCCGRAGASQVRSLGRNTTLYQPYQLAGINQRIVVGTVRVQAQQGTQITSVDVENGKGAVTVPFMTASMTATQTTAVTDLLLIIGNDGSVFWAPSSVLGLGPNRIGVTNENWRAAAAQCGSYATPPLGNNNLDQWAAFRTQTLTSVCIAAEAKATIMNSPNKAVRFEGCAGQSTALVLLRLDARAFTLVRRFAAPVITDAGLLIGTASPVNGGVIFVDVANRGADGVVSVTLSMCCGVAGACNGFRADDPVSHALSSAETARFKLAFLVVGGRGDGAYCIAELWQGGKKEGSVRIALVLEAAHDGHASDVDGPIWTGPISAPELTLSPNSSCSSAPIQYACGCGATLLDGECKLVLPNTTRELLCGEHGKPEAEKCVCDEGWGTREDQPALHFVWCTEVLVKDDTKLKHYNTGLNRLFIIVPVLLSLCCCCCCGYICVSIGCKIRACCRRRKAKKKEREANKKSTEISRTISVP